MYSLHIDNKRKLHALYSWYCFKSADSLCSVERHLYQLARAGIFWKTETDLILPTLSLTSKGNWLQAKKHC